jgi:amino acid transporter
MKIIDLVFGRRLANQEHEERKIGWAAAVPAMGLDGLGSSSYGPEAALTILMPLGAASLYNVGWVIAPIVGLLAILYVSYRQTLLAYPSNGGAYTVAKENLGRGGALLAAAALMIDYVLNVAVGISAGVGALTSSFPLLHPYTLWLCLAILAVVAMTNLRGTREAGWLFAAPTYLFLASFLGIIGYGLVRLYLGGSPHPVVAPPSLPPATEALSAWLFMRAFAAGCTAMTGVEAVSNGVDAFREPVVREARATLTIICAALGLLLVGVAFIAQGYGIGAMDQARPGYQSVMSQLVAAVAGRGTLYYVAMSSLLAVLCLSANTSYVGFPRICRLVALDDYLPRSFAVSDRRLVFSVGVLFLTVTGGALLVVFGGITDRLIPLFAIGAFLTFTLSQLGMVVHWRRVGGEGRRLAVNALGAVTTIVALVVITVAKFAEGAWIVALAVPATIAVLLSVHRYYARLERKLSVSGEFRIEKTGPPTVVVAYEERNRMTDRALHFALTLSPDVIAVHLLRLRDPELDEDLNEIRETFATEVAAPVEKAGLTPPRLMFLRAAYREMAGPLIGLIDKIDQAAPERAVAILIPEQVHLHWWQWLLHGRRARQLRAALMEHAGPRLMIITAPWRG